MKSKLILPVIASLFAVVCQPANAQVTAATTPIGYQKLTITSLAGSPVFNLIGVNFQNKTLAIGTITAEAANSITDSLADFTTAFAGTSSYLGSPNLVVEITTGANAGANTDVTAVPSSTVLTTNDDLSLVSDPGDTYVVRELNTPASIFGPNNEAALKPGDATTADKVWIPLAGGGFDKVFYTLGGGFPVLTAGWKRVGGANADASTYPMYSTAGLIVERQAAQPTPLEVIVEGWVRTTSAKVGILTGFNFLDSLFPVGATLGNSGLDALTHGFATPPTADLVWLPDGVGGWTKYYYTDGGGFPVLTPGWKKVGGANVDESGKALTTGIVIERLGAPINIDITPDPAIYGPL